jgi:hypothetical protein
MKFFRFIFKEIRETFVYVSHKDQIELLLRGVSAASFFAIFFSQNNAMAFLAFVISLWMKKKNSERRG